MAAVQSVRCIKCFEANNPSFTHCWKCNEVLVKNSETIVMKSRLCHACKMRVDEKASVCSYCGEKLGMQGTFEAIANLSWWVAVLCFTPFLIMLLMKLLGG